MSDGATALSRNDSLTVIVKTCATCGSTLGQANRSGYCRKHLSAAQAQNPAWREKQRTGAKRALMADPERRERVREFARKMQKTKGATEARRAAILRDRPWERGTGQSHTPEANAKRAATLRAKALSWCPAHLRDEYRHLVKGKRIPSVEARAMILAQEEAELAALRKRMGAAVANEPSEIELPRFVYSVKRIGPREMILIAANVLNLEPDDIVSASRLEQHVGARAAIARAMRERGASYTAIAEALNRRDHSTVVHALNVYDETVRRYPPTARAYDAIKQAEARAAERLAA